MKPIKNATNLSNFLGLYILPCFFKILILSRFNSVFTSFWSQVQQNWIMLLFLTFDEEFESGIDSRFCSIFQPNISRIAFFFFMFRLFWPRIFIFCFVYATEKLDFMLKTEIASKIRIRSEMWNFWHLGRIPIEILKQKSGIRKSSSSSRRCRTPELEFWLVW